MDKLTFNELRDFKKFYEIITTEDMCAPPQVCRTYRAFRFLQVFAGTLIHEEKFPALNRCWQDLCGRYSNEPIFEDGVFLESWIFLDFPIDRRGTTVLDEFSNFWSNNDKAVSEFGCFIETARVSRFGLYQEIRSTSRVTVFRELFTERTIETLRSVPDYNSGEIFLGRIIQSEGDHFLLGDPKNWPGNFKNNLIDAVSARLSAIVGDSDSQRYERFMKMAGPYWMSCVSQEDGEILPPNYWITFHEND